MNDKPIKSEYDKVTAITVAIALIVVGPAVFLILPVFIGAIAEALKFDDAQLGILGSADLAGMALATLFMVRLIRRPAWRLYLVVGLIGSILGNVISVFIAEYETLVAVRFVTGFSGGAVASVVTAFIARTSKPDRVASFLVISQVSFQVIAFAVSPYYLGFAGLKGVYIFLAALALVILPFVRMIPRGETLNRPESSHQETSRQAWPAFAVMISMAFFFIGQSSIWAFLERIGDSSGFSPAFIANALAITTLLGIAGAVFSATFDLRFGRFKPLLIAGIVQIACLALLTGEISGTAFLIVLSVFQLFWNMAIAYQIGLTVAKDTTGSYVVLIPTFQAIGLALGPALGGIAASSIGYVGVNLVSAGALAIYLVIILPMAAPQRQAVAAD